jgi:hypothetical protein
MESHDTYKVGRSIKTKGKPSMSLNNPSQDQRLERLEDVEKIKEIKYLYACHLDDGFDAESIAGLFTEDGEWIIKGVGGEVRGRAAIKFHCENLKSNISWSQHNIFAPRIELNAEGDKAVARFNLVCLLTMNSDANGSSGEAYILAGHYEDQLVKVGGKWFFKAMTGVIEQSSPWTQGWVNSPFKKESW